MIKSTIFFSLFTILSYTHIFAHPYGWYIQTSVVLSTTNYGANWIEAFISGGEKFIKTNKTVLIKS